MHPSAFQKTVAITLPVKVSVLAFFFWRCCVVLFHALSFHLWVKMVESASYHQSWTARHYPLQLVKV